MNCIELNLPGLFLIEPNIFKDERGQFRRSFCKEEFKKFGMNNMVSQGNISENPFLGTLRGFHYQSEPCKEAKTITCITGAIYNVVIDLRPTSPKFLKHYVIEISAQDKKSIHIPYGCANAWITTQKNTIIHYYMSDLYSPDHGRGIRYNDPFFNISWPFEPKILSSKDLSYENFSKNDFLKN